MASKAKSGQSLGVALVVVLILGVVALAGLSQLGGPSGAPAVASLAAGERFILAAAHAAGAVGTNWRTDLEVHNPLGSEASYSIALLRENSDNSAPQTVSRTLAAGRSERLSDLLLGLFGYDGSAALRIAVSAGGVLISSRTYNQVAEGTYGQFIGYVRDAWAVDYGEQVRLIQLTHNRSSSSGFRTNIGLVNAVASTIGVRADFFRSDGSYLGTQSYSLPPLAYLARNKVFESVTGGDVEDGYVVIETTTQGGRFFAFASVVDNRTGDPIYVPGLAVAGSLGPTPTATATGNPTATPTRTPTMTPTRTPTATTAGANIRPYQPDGWSGPLVASNVQNTTVTGALVAGQTTYLDGAILNDGTQLLSWTGNQVMADLQFDGQHLTNVVAPAEGLTLQPGYYTSFRDLSITGIAAGQHTITIVCDPENMIAESNEADNSYTFTGTWSGKAGGGGARALPVTVVTARVGVAPQSERGTQGLVRDRLRVVEPPDRSGWAKLAAGEVVYIPASAHVAGASGTNWRTDLELHNPGSDQGQYEIAVLRENQANTSPQTVTISLSPGRCQRLEDVLFGQFGASGNAALRIRPVQGSLLTTSRTYNLTSDGTYGQFIPGLTESEVVAAGQEGRLIQLSHNRSTTAGYRTNIGFLNPTASSVNLDVGLYTSAGALLGSLQYSLEPYMLRQVNKIFEAVTGADVAEGYAVVTVASGSGSFFAYASVVDNATGDPIFVPAIRLGSSAPTPTPTPTRTPTPTPGGTITVTVSPADVSLNPGASQQFTATVTGTGNTAVTWSVQEGVTGGSVTQSGLYTAPLLAGTYHVIATSQADPSRKGTATVHIEEVPLGVIFGRVFGPGKAAPIAGITVTVAGQSVVTNEQGYYTVNDVPASERAVVNFVGAGYVQATEIVRVVGGVGTFLDAQMVSVEAEAEVSGAQGGEVTTPDGGGLGIFGGTLVDPQGAPYTGTATVQVTTFDPSDPVEMAAFPGEFEGVTHTGETVPFVSFGFADVGVFSSGTTPQPLELATGQTAELTIPIPTDSVAGAPATLPQWWFNPVEGRWHEEGTFTRDGNVYRGRISHFSIWNCDVSGNRCFVTGRVVDPGGIPVECARVEILSQRNSGGWVSSGESCTGSDGTFRIPVEAESQMTYWASKGTVETPRYGPRYTCEYYQETSVGDLILGTAVGAATITLTWGASPRDLDSHLGVPTTSGCYHAYFGNRQPDPVEGVVLNTDDTDGLGPEIFTIFAPLHQGTYRYSVHQWSSDGTISSSGAVVNLIVEGVGTWTFRPPGGSSGSGDVWRVFDIEFNGSQVVVDQIGQILSGLPYTDDTFCAP